MGHNIPPEYPFFVGQPIRYHYLFYAVVGGLEALGVRIDLALNVLSAAGMTLLLYMIFLVTKLFFGKARVGVLAVVLVLFNGSLAFVEYFTQHGWLWQSVLALPQQTAFASFGPWSGRLVSAFWNWNIYTNQRHLAWGYGLVLLLWYPLLLLSTKHTKKIDWQRRGWPQVAKVAIMLAFLLLPLLHQASFLLLAASVTAWLLLYPKVTRPLRLTYVTALILSAGVFLAFTVGSTQQWQVLLGYLAPDKSPLGLLEYWGYNLGLYLLLIPAALWWSVKRKNAFLPILFVFFIIANVLRLSTDMINNHKFINFFVIGLSITVAGMLAQLAERWRALWPVLIITVGMLTFSGFIDTFPIINDKKGLVPDYGSSEIIRYLMQNTPSRSQFVTNTYLYNPASLAGRMLYLDYGYHAWSMGYVDAPKRSLLSSIFAQLQTKDAWCDLLLNQGVSYILLNPNLEPVEDGRVTVRESFIVRELAPVFTSADGWKLYDVAATCF